MRRRFALLVLLSAPFAGSAAPAHALAPGLAPSLARTMALAGPRSGALVVDAGDGRVLYALRADAPRIPASNEKLFVTSTALLRYGPSGTLTTRVLANGNLDSSGTFRGTLYLRGGGDPTFGSLSFTRRAYGGGATTYELARRLRGAGLRRVQGAVLGDESLFDRRRAAFGFGISLDIGGPLSALSYDRGLSHAGSGFQLRPATFAASQLVVALRAQSIPVVGRTGEGVAPAGSREMVNVPSLPMATIIRLINRPSDNYLAEMLIKALGASFAGRGTTAAGAGVVRSRLSALGVHAHVVDGSGLSRLDRTSPRDVVRLLTAMNGSPDVSGAFQASLAVAGRSGTLAHRLGGTAAAGRCRGKTGTLIGASALSGYCDTIGGRRVAFSFLMNGIGVGRAHAVQDAMAAAIVRAG